MNYLALRAADPAAAATFAVDKMGFSLAHAAPEGRTISSPRRRSLLARLQARRRAGRGYFPRTWTVADPHVVDGWQTGPPPLGLMGPPPSEPDTPEQAKLREEVFGRVKLMLNKRLYVGLSKVNMSSGPPPIDVVHAPSTSRTGPTRSPDG